jgi:hypothetical protein
VPEGLAGLSFLTDDFDAAHLAAQGFASDVTLLDAGVPGVQLFFCTMGGVPVEFMGGFKPT